MRCPWCRETLPLRAGAACPHCGKPLEETSGAKVRPLDLDYDAILRDADESSLRWCNRGAAFAFCAALFSIVPATGVLTFNSAPNFEAPGDAGANNVYDVQVTVTDSGTQTATQNIQVTVTDVDAAGFTYAADQNAATQVTINRR